MSIARQHPFWGSLSPLGGLTGGGLLIIASTHLAWAVTVAIGLFWVYGLTIIAFSFLASPMCRKFFPSGGRAAIFTCMASFFGSVYLLLFWFLCPFAAFEVFVPMLLVPLFCAESGIYESIQATVQTPHADIESCVSEAGSKTAVLAGLLVAFSIVREPLSYCSLTFPGTYQGMVTIMYFRAGSFFPAGIFTASAGALLLLGYFISLYQYCKNIFAPGEKN